MRISDWSSDVCSSDLVDDFAARLHRLVDLPHAVDLDIAARRGLRRGGKGVGQVTGSGHGLLGGEGDGLDAVAIGIADEGGIIAGCILRADAGAAVILAAMVQRQGMESLDGGAAVGAETDMAAGVRVARRRAGAGIEPELRPGGAIAETGR